MFVANALMERTLQFIETDEVMKILSDVTSGWCLTTIDTTRSAPIVIRRVAQGYEIAEPGRRAFTEPSAVSAVCSLVVILLNRMIEEDPRMLCLHAACAQIGSHTIVFPSTHRTGKSTMMAALTFAGSALVADDVLPIDCGGEIPLAVATGVTSRLRMPLPKELGARFRFDAWRHAGPDDGYYRYLSLGARQLQRFGARVPINAFIYLQRGGATRPQLKSLSPHAASRLVLGQNFGRAATSDVVLARARALATSRPSFVLEYDNLSDGRRALMSIFRCEKDLPRLWHSLPQSDFEPLAAQAAVLENQIELDGNLIIHRRSGVLIESDERGAFLADRVEGGIFLLDGLGAQIWEKMEHPVAVSELRDALQQTFPDVDAVRISRDLDSLVNALAEKQLVRLEPST